MTFLVFLLYIALLYLFPAEIFPELAPYRIAFWVGVTGLGVSTASLFVRRSPLSAAQSWLLVGFVATLGLSRLIADNWLGAPLAVLEQFAPSLAMFVLAVCGVTSLGRLRATAITMTALSILLTIQGGAAYHFGYGGG